MPSQEIPDPTIICLCLGRHQTSRDYDRPHSIVQDHSFFPLEYEPYVGYRSRI